MNDAPLQLGQQSLGRRLVTVTLLFCVLFILLSTSLRTYLAWNGNLQNMRNELQLIDQVFRATLSKAIWEMDEDTLHTQLDSVSQAGAVGLIELRILREGREPQVIRHQAADYQETSRAPELYEKLSYAPTLVARRISASCAWWAMKPCSGKNWSVTSPPFSWRRCCRA